MAAEQGERGADTPGAKGGLTARRQRNTLPPPANAAPAGGERRGLQSAPPVQELPPIYDKKIMLKSALLFLPGFVIPLSGGLYYIAFAYLILVAFVMLVMPLLARYL